VAPQDPVPGLQTSPRSAEEDPSLPHARTGHAHAEGDDHDHGAGEAFPRLRVRDLIGARFSAEEQRERWQTVCLSLGLMLMALALPTEQLLGEGPSLVEATDRGQWTSGQPLLQPLARLLSLLPGRGAARAGLLIAAACWAACYPVLLGMLSALGLPRLAAGAATLAVMLSPAAQLCATLPGPSAAAMLGTAILLRHLWGTPTHTEVGPRRTLGVWFAVCLLHTSLVLLLPAVLVRLLCREPGAAVGTGAQRSQVWRGAAAGLLLLLALLGLASLGRPAGMDFLGFWARVRDSLLGSASHGGPSRLTWCLVLGPTLGVGLLGLVELLRKPRAETESRPPTWLWVFVAVPLLLPAVHGRPSLEQAAWTLSPALALGLASWFSRLIERRRTRLIGILLVAQVILSLSFRLTSTSADVNRAWTLLASELLAPGDLVITDNEQHDYLLRHRFGLATLDLKDPRALKALERAHWWENARNLVRTQQRADRGVWVDWPRNQPLGGKRGFEFSRELHELVLLAPTRHLDPRELRAAESNSTPLAVEPQDF